MIMTWKQKPVNIQVNTTSDKIKGGILKMNTDTLHSIINDAQKKNKAVELYINFIRERITIEPGQEINITDHVLKIDDKIFISTEHIIMVQITMNKKEREEHIKKLFKELEKEAE